MVLKAMLQVIKAKVERELFTRLFGSPPLGPPGLSGGAVASADTPTHALYTARARRPMARKQPRRPARRRRQSISPKWADFERRPTVREG